MTTTLTITHLGREGDGLAQWRGKGVGFPFTLPGEKISVNEQGEMDVLVTPSPSRIAPACTHFGVCGGCRLQHGNADFIAAWKRGLVTHLLQKQGIPTVCEKIFTTPAQSRRRVNLTARHDGKAIILGFQRRESHALLDITQCPVLRPSLLNLITPLRGALTEIMLARQEAELQINDVNGSIDILVTGASFTPAQKTALATFAAAQHITRLCLQESIESEAEILLSAHPVTTRYGAFTVALPTGAFMQASAEAEGAMLDFIRPFMKKAKTYADLFCGSGLFALSFHEKGRKILALDHAGPAITALQEAARGAPAIKAERRNLFRDPLSAHEAQDLDAVILDPPRNGAEAQARALAVSRVPLIIYVSCNPHSFARDARILGEGGYRLADLHAFDQFLWSQHVEVVGIFKK
jgi:23S rRNA (uracil1939-C5)-methyltransferase